MKIIWINGKQGSGKTTLQKSLAKALYERPGYRHHLLNFADPLHKMERFCVGVLEEMGIVRDIKKDGDLMQLLGTEWGRKKISETIWVDGLKNRIHQTLAKNIEYKNVFIVGDCRFKNEADAFPEALKIRLECDKQTRKFRAEYWRENEMHPSEIDLDEYVHIPGKFDLIFNTGTQSVEHCTNVILSALDRDK